MGISGHLHTPTALLVEKETPGPTEHEACAPQSWSVLFGKKVNLLPLQGI